MKNLTVSVKNFVIGIQCDDDVSFDFKWPYSLDEKEKTNIIIPVHKEMFGLQEGNSLLITYIRIEFYTQKIIEIGEELWGDITYSVNIESTDGYCINILIGLAKI